MLLLDWCRLRLDASAAAVAGSSDGGAMSRISHTLTSSLLKSCKQSTSFTCLSNSRQRTVFGNVYLLVTLLQ